VKSKLNSVKIFKFSINFEKEWYIKFPYLAKNSGKKIWSIWAKFGQRLEKVSQARILRFHSNKHDFGKLE
jgi:hypothetical protein